MPRHHSILRFRPSRSPQRCSQSTRLFGSRPGSPGARPAPIHLDDDRDDPSSVPVDLRALRRTVETTRDIVGYPTYDVSLTLVGDDFMTEINGATRGVGKPTDVLSFCFQGSFVAPGVLGDVQFDVPEYYNLGDMVIDVDYVRRRCEEDRRAHAEERKGKGDRDRDGEATEGEFVSERVDPDEEEEDGYEYEYVDEYDDRGVAPAMQHVYDPEIRIHMLIVHGMLHLVGYDHIEDEDYELMVVREEEVLAELRTRLGEHFGVKPVAFPVGDAYHQT